MASGATTNLNHQKTSHLKLGLLNAENLFLLFDHEIPQYYQKLNEAQWQKLSSSVYENKSLEKCQQLSLLIKQNAPDIMMLCEVGGKESLKNFNKLFLDTVYDVALIEGNSDRNIDVGFLIRKDLSLSFSIHTHKNRLLNFLYPHESTSKKTGYPSPPTHFFSRDCAELHLQHPTENVPFMIILLTHLKSRLDPERIDPGGTERRSAELRTCVDIYKELQQCHPASYIMLCGDMNGYAAKENTDPEFAPVYSETDLVDVLEVSQIEIEKRATYYQIKSGGRNEGRQIDYCFLSNNLHAKLSDAEVFRYRDEYGFAFDPPKSLEDKLRLPSDHYPLFFTLEKL